MNTISSNAAIFLTANTIRLVRTSSSRSPWRRGLLPIALGLILTWLALSPAARAQCPDQGCDDIFNGADTWYGLGAFSITSGVENAAFGFVALQYNTGSFNTAIGSRALRANFDAVGTGSYNTASGYNALTSNLTGSYNTASGISALSSNTTGSNNTALGNGALLKNTTGSNNIALGASAGTNLTTGSNNIHIGAFGYGGESNTIRIGRGGIQTAVFINGVRGATVAGGVTVMVDASGHLGTITSSARYKESIQPMDKASEAILALQPVTFRYKQELDPEGIPQFGLVAEQVEKVDPDLVARDEAGKPYTVRYEAVNAMLLNEFLKEHRRVEEQVATIAIVKATIAKQDQTIAHQQKEFRATVEQQKKEINALTAALKAQAAQIQKVSDQIKTQAPAPRVVAND